MKQKSKLVEEKKNKIRLQNILQLPVGEGRSQTRCGLPPPSLGAAHSCTDVAFSGCPPEQLHQQCQPQPASTPISSARTESGYGVSLGSVEHTVQAAPEAGPKPQQIPGAASCSQAQPSAFCQSLCRCISDHFFQSRTGKSGSVTQSLLLPQSLTHHVYLPQDSAVPALTLKTDILSLWFSL